MNSPIGLEKGPDKYYNRLYFILLYRVRPNPMCGDF